MRVGGPTDEGVVVAEGCELKYGCGAVGLYVQPGPGLGGNRNAGEVQRHRAAACDGNVQGVRQQPVGDVCGGRSRATEDVAKREERLGQAKTALKIAAWVSKLTLCGAQT